MTRLIAKIFGAVVAAKPSLALRNGQVIARCGCQNNGIKSGAGVPARLKIPSRQSCEIAAGVFVRDQIDSKDFRRGSGGKT